MRCQGHKSRVTGGVLGRAFDSPDAKRRYVRQLFSTIADRYDIATVLLSYGRDRRWKRVLTDRAMRTVSPAVGQVSVLDLACGTGDVTLSLSARGIAVVGLDLTPRMLEIASRKAIQDTGLCTFVVGDMMALPFPDNYFNLVTVGYGLRNVPILDEALREVRRVLCPGGSVISLDFNRPDNVLLRGVYLGYLTVVGSLLGVLMHGDLDTYRYIAVSLRHYPGASGVAKIMGELTFCDVGYTSLMGGLMAINYGMKPTVGLRKTPEGFWTSPKK